MCQNKKPFILLLCGVLLLTCVFTAPPAKAADSVWYKVYSWNGSALSSERKPESSAVPFPNSTTVAPGWYIVDRDLTINGRVSLEGDTHLILGDGNTLNVKGLYIPKGYTLYIYGQDEGSGKLISIPTAGSAIGAYSGHKGGNIEIHGGYIEARGYDHCAGIGGNDGDLTDLGSITIYHGDVNAYGGSAGAGIGGGQACEGGKITIYGGKVYGEGGHYGAGIGGGNGKDNPVKGAHGGTITIWGGNVTAKGGDDGAGIGGGEGGNAGTIVIHGGTVTATGGNNSAGIGCGEGESTGKGGSVTINGGTVTATGGDDGAGIGGGEDGYCTITINGGTVTANGGRQAAAIGGGNNADSNDITIIGGTITANAHSNHGKGIGSGYDSDKKTNIYLNYTEETENTLSISTGNYCGKVMLWKAFKTKNGGETFAAGSHGSGDDLDGKTIVPAGISWTTAEYKDLSGTTQTKVCVQVTSSSTAWADDWYVVNSNVTISSEITIIGKVNLILADGYTLTAQNIKVAAGNSFTVWGQSGTGKLVATSTDAVKAGIGGADCEYGSITINGGTVEAKGGGIYRESGSAGIGGAFSRTNRSGTVVINGGKVKATGGYGSAGIGLAQRGGSGRVEIHGGEVEAHGTTGGAGIGGGAAFQESYGNWRDVGTVIITGGTVKAYGSIGETTKGGAAAIGGGYLCQAGTIKISGGKVYAYSNGGSAGIGGGSAALLYKSARCNGGNITISGGTVYAQGNKKYAAAIGGGFKGGGINITITGGNITAVDGFVSIGRGRGRDYSYDWGNPCNVTVSWTENNKYSMSLRVTNEYSPENAENNITLNSAFVDPATGEIFNNDNKPQKIFADRTLVPYTGEALPVVVNVVGEGTVLLDQETANPQENVRFKPVPGDGYGVYSVTVDGKEVLPDAENKYSFTMGYVVPDVTVTFKPLTPWSALQNEVDSAASPVINLGGNVTATAEDKPLYIPAGKTVTLNLNGYTLNRGLSGGNAKANGYAIRNDGTLIVTGNGTGMITGGNRSGDGGCIVNNGTLTLTDVTITGNKATQKGGGILQNGTINVSGKTIVSGNTASNGSNSNIFLPKDHPVINVTGTLSQEAAIWVTSETGTGVLTDGLTQSGNAALVSVFCSDNADCSVILDPDSGEAILTTEATVTVTFDSNGGTEQIPVQTILLGGTAQRPAEGPQKNYADFLGWYQVTDPATGEVAEEPYDFTTAVTESITLKALWDEYSAWKILGLQLQQGGDITLTENTTAAAADEMLVVPAGATVTLDLNGYTLDGSALMEASDQTIESEAVLLNKGTFTLLDTSTGKTGKLTGGEQINVVLNRDLFILSGGTVSGSSDYTIVNNQGGFRMNGGRIIGTDEWNGIAVYSNGEFEIGGCPEISGMVLLEDNCTIRLASSGLDSAARIQVGSVAAQLYNEPAVITSGLAYGAAENFTTDDQHFILALNGQGEMMIGPRVNVSFDSDGGSAVETQAIMAGSAATEPEADPVRENYHFMGWYEVADGEGTLAEEEFDFTAPLTESLTLKAVWGNTVNFAAGDENATGMMDPVLVATGTDYELPECGFLSTGKTFVIWSVARTDSGDPEGADTRAAGTEITVTADLIATAVWSTDCCTVTFDSEGGSAVAEQKVEFGSTAEEPEDPERPGFSFMGWYQVTAEAGVETLADDTFNFGTEIRENIVLRAVWGNYVTFEAGVAGTAGAMNALIIPTGSVYELPPCDYSTDGRVFREWSVVIGEAEPVLKLPTDQITITADTVVMAMWQPIPFGTVDFDIPGSVSVIEDNAFEGIAATVVEIPESCARIGNEAFKECAHLTMIRIPAGCMLGTDVFDGCTKVYVFSAVGSDSQRYCYENANCVFVEDAQD